MSNHLHFGIRGEVFEDLRHIDFGVVGGEGAVPEDGAEGLLLCHILHHGAGHIGAEAGHESAVVHIMDGAAVQVGAGVGQVDFHAPVQQAGVEQIQIGAVVLDVGHQVEHGLLIQLLRLVVHILHVAAVHPEDTETNVQILCAQGVILFDFVTRPADAFLADLADIFVAGLECLGLLVTGSRQLYHDKLAVAAVLGVELHHRMGGGGGAREKV